MSTRSFVWASPLLCAALFVACAEERSVTQSVTAPSFSAQGAPAAPAAFRFYQHTTCCPTCRGGGQGRSKPGERLGARVRPATPWWISDNGTGRSTLYSVGPPPSRQFLWFRARGPGRARRPAWCSTAARALW